MLDQREFIDGLGVIRDRSIRVDRDGHRAHAEETECNQTKCENRRRQHEVGAQSLGEVVAQPHQRDHRESQPVRREIAGN